jgi:hypothetical protein
MGCAELRQWFVDADRQRVGREVAWALELAFDDANSSSQSKEILTHVDARLRSLTRSHVRKKYIHANLIAFIAIEGCFALDRRHPLAPFNKFG